MISKEKFVLFMGIMIGICIAGLLAIAWLWRMTI